MKKKLQTNAQPTVIVTGGNRGIGEAITRAFYEAGYNVVVGGRTDSGLAKKIGPRARFVKMDVRFDKDHEMLAHAALSWTGRLDCYINCAGVSAWRPVEEVDEVFWNEIIDTNLKGTLWGCKTAARFLSEKGCIINISSIAGKRGTPNMSVYHASKFGVNGITQALAKELGPRGIRVNAVCPILIKTPGLVEALKDRRSPAAGGDIDEFFKARAASQPALGRLPTSSEVASVCIFLASEGASAITGQCLNVDCGVLPQ